MNSFLLIAVLISLVAGYPEKIMYDPLVSLYDRLVVITKDENNIGSVNPLAFIDPLHQRMLALGYYTQADVNRLDRDSIAFIYHFYGINVTEGFYNATIGSYASSEWFFFPFQITDPLDLVAFDSENLKRGAEGNWMHVDSGNLLVFLRNGTFRGGVNANYTFQPNDGIIYDHFDLVKMDSCWRNCSKYREQFLCYTTVTAKQFTDMYGLLDSVIRFECDDEYGRHGKALTTNVYTLHRNGTRDEWKRSVMTFPNEE